MKRASIFMIIAVLIVLFAGCSQVDEAGGIESSAPPTPSFSAGETEESPAPSEEIVESSAPGKTVSETAPADNQTPEISKPADSNSSKTQSATNPPTNPPATSQPGTPPSPTTSTPPTPSKPTYTEKDYQNIIDTIRAYGEAKGFIWQESYTFEQGHQYYGRPNLERDGYEGVVNMLKYNCDQIEMYCGICYFKVVKHIYEGNTEFVVLYD